MYTGNERTTTVRAGTSTRILAAALRLLARKGTDGVTMRALAERVKLTPMAIYRHFPGRAALLNALADEGFRTLAARLAATTLDGDVMARLMQLAEVFLDHALESPHMHDLMFLARREGARSYPEDFRAGRSPTFSPSVQVLEEGMRLGELRRDDALEIAFELSALSHGLLVLYYGGRIGMDAEQFRTLYRGSFRRYLDGLRA